MVTPFTIQWSSRFKKDYRKMRRQGKDMSKLDEAIVKLANRVPLPESMHDHALSHNWAHHRECHIAPDWLLIYHVCEDMLVLELTRTGSHSDLFD
ncbi:MAG: type II toxin-antitoxin system YafQ family toxin [Kiritimatiellia bacterium]